MSSIAAQIDRIKANVAAAFAALREKGVAVADDATSDDLATLIGGLDVGDMNKSTYDTNNNGVVDNAEKLGGKTASDFASAPTQLYLTLPAANWNATYKTLYAANKAFSPSTIAIVSPEDSSFVAWSEAGVRAYPECSPGEMVFHCETIPTQDLQCYVLILG